MGSILGLPGLRPVGCAGWEAAELQGVGWGLVENLPGAEPGSAFSLLLPFYPLESAEMSHQGSGLRAWVLLSPTP